MQVTSFPMMTFFMLDDADANTLAIAMESLKFQYTVSILSHPWKAFESIKFNPEGKEMDVNELQFLKAY